MESSTECEPRTSRCSSWIYKRQRNQRSNWQQLLDHRKSKRIPEKHLLLLYWLCQSLCCVDNNTLWKILKEMGIPEHLTCLLRNLQVKKQQLALDMGQQTGSQLGKEYVKATYCHPAYLTHVQCTSWEMLGRMKNKLETKLLGEIPITSDMQMIPPLWQKVKNNWRAFWWKWNRRVKK